MYISTYKLDNRVLLHIEIPAMVLRSSCWMSSSRCGEPESTERRNVDVMLGKVW